MLEKKTITQYAMQGFVFTPCPIYPIIFLLLFSCAAFGDSAPTCDITKPANGQMFQPGEQISFEGNGLDLEDGELSGESLIWTSDVDNHIGTGTCFQKSLSAGNHIVMLKATDSKGNYRYDSILVRVSRKAPGTISKENTVKEENGRMGPEIELTHLPGMGSSDNLRGRIRNHGPGKYSIAVYIRVDGRWWTKPYWNRPSTIVSQDGSWECDITTGGLDEMATHVAVFLMPAGKEPALARGDLVLPKRTSENAVTGLVVDRSRSAKDESKDEAKKGVHSDEQKPKKFWGVCYGPFRENENPDKGVFPLAKSLEEDMALIPKVATAVRTYGAGNSLGIIPELCEKAGISCYVGAWIGKHDDANIRELRSLVSIAAKEYKCVKGLIIGNEVLLRKDMTEDDLILETLRVRIALKFAERGESIPISTADIWQVWLKHPKLAGCVDFITAHIHPYWEGIPIEDAAQHVVNVWKSLKKAYPGKSVVIGETGWPSEGKTVGRAVPSQENQARFIREFTELAGEENIPYFLFELFDEKWKDAFEGNTGAHWGVYGTDGAPKKSNISLLNPDAVKGISRPPRKVEPLSAKTPLSVYSDYLLDEAFEPTGWMGDRNLIGLEKGCKHKPHSGKTCIKLTYQTGYLGRENWAGIYWQYPINNWGDYPGYFLKGAGKLTFWARGEKGCEVAEFKAGGISSWNKEYKDSFGPLTTGPVKLTREWKKYTIDLGKADLSNVIGGFCWVARRSQNREGHTIYLDDIKYEP